MERVGNPSSGVLIQPGTLVDLPEVWADRYIACGSAEEVVEKQKAEQPKPKTEKPKGKKKKS